jgi:truncated hemoglobin YjbI
MSTPSPERITVTLEFDPEEMSRRGRIGAHRLHATHDPRETTAKARETFLTQLERAVDPDGTLSPEERRRRAEHAKKAHFARLARLSAEARRKPKTPVVSGA